MFRITTIKTKKPKPTKQKVMREIKEIEVNGKIPNIHGLEENIVKM